MYVQATFVLHSSYAVLQKMSIILHSAVNGAPLSACQQVLHIIMTHVLTCLQTQCDSRSQELRLYGVKDYSHPLSLCNLQLSSCCRPHYAKGASQIVPEPSGLSYSPSAVWQMEPNDPACDEDKSKGSTIGAATAQALKQAGHCRICLLQPGT